VNAPNKICWIIHILYYLCLLSIISPIIKYGGVEKLSNGTYKHLELNHKLFKKCSGIARILVPGASNQNGKPQEKLLI